MQAHTLGPALSSRNPRCMSRPSRARPRTLRVRAYFSNPPNPETRSVTASSSQRPETSSPSDKRVQQRPPGLLDRVRLALSGAQEQQSELEGFEMPQWVLEEDSPPRQMYTSHLFERAALEPRKKW